MCNYSVFAFKGQREERERESWRRKGRERKSWLKEGTTGRRAEALEKEAEEEDEEIEVRKSRGIMRWKTSGMRD